VSHGTDGQFHIRMAALSDLPEAGEVYLAAFQKSLEELGAQHLSARALADIMSPCLLAEPECMVVAEASGQAGLVGYAIGMTDPGAMWRPLAARGLPLLWLGRWLAGRYGLPLRAAIALLGDAVRLTIARSRMPTAGGARIMSIAVRPQRQGHGLGARLLGEALRRLRHSPVWLEVRAKNVPAQRLYRRFGFRFVTSFSDSRGRWDVMVLDPQSVPPGP
jgi:ribosomal protein S18 acetylase RimI-like enzyme